MPEHCRIDHFHSNLPYYCQSKFEADRRWTRELFIPTVLTIRRTALGLLSLIFSMIFAAVILGLEKRKIIDDPAVSITKWSTSYRNNSRSHDNNRRSLNYALNNKHQSMSAEKRNWRSRWSSDRIFFTCASAISSIGERDRTPWNSGMQSTKLRYDDESASLLPAGVRSLRRTPFTASSGYLARCRNIFTKATVLISDISGMMQETWINLIESK